MCSAKYAKEHGNVDGAFKTSDHQFNDCLRYATGSSPEVIKQWLRLLKALEDGNIIDKFVPKKDGTVDAVKAVRCMFLICFFASQTLRASQRLKHR